MVSEIPSTQKQKTQTGAFKNIESKLKKIEPVYMAGDINETIKTGLENLTTPSSKHTNSSEAG